LPPLSSRGSRVQIYCSGSLVSRISQSSGRQGLGTGFLAPLVSAVVIHVKRRQLCDIFGPFFPGCGACLLAVAGCWASAMSIRVPAGLPGTTLGGSGFHVVPVFTTLKPQLLTTCRRLLSHHLTARVADGPLRNQQKMVHHVTPQMDLVKE
jgi:hypothetical protein